MGPDDLAQVLRLLPPSTPNPNLLVGTGTSDDAGVYRLSDDLALVQTVDFFTPMVDDPYTFGQIAAANALSDVYAMGGQPLTCLNIACFPIDQLPLDVLAEILKGGAERVSAAGATLVGGHTVEDEEPKYGLAVTGLVHPQRILTNAGAQPGNLLVLTKPLGVGIITTAMKRTELPASQIEAVVDTMVALNDTAARVAVKYGASACTDVTGFGFLGHLGEMVRGAELGAEVWLARVPLLSGARELAAKGYVCGGSKANLRHALRFTEFASGDELDRILLADTVTSGGLLFAIAPGQAEAALAELQADGVTAAIVGEVVADHPGIIVVR